MVENVLVKEQLTREMIDAGALLTTKLRENGLPITAAFWSFIADLNEWRLYFATPVVHSRGRRPVYEQIDRALAELGDKAAPLTFLSTSVMPDDSVTARAIRSAMEAYPPGPIRLRRSYPNGHLIEDALIYPAA